MIRSVLDIISGMSSTSKRAMQRPAPADDDYELDVDETEQVTSASNRRRISPSPIPSTTSNVPLGTIDETKINLLSVLFVENRKSRTTSFNSEMTKTFSPDASKFDSYCRQAIPGLFLKRFQRTPQEALHDLKQYVIGMGICDAPFFDSWRQWRPQSTTQFRTQRGQQKQSKAQGPKPSNERRWLDLYATLRREAFSNWVRFFLFPSSRIFVNALSSDYGTLYRKRNAHPRSAFFDFEWKRKLTDIENPQSMHSYTLTNMYVINAGALLGIFLFI